MPLPAPNLDDRTFEQLLSEARALVARSDTDWTDLSPGDPGMVLLEAFAYLTSLMLYRLNRLPEKVHIELLRLIGVQLAPPAAAQALLTFRLARARDVAVEIPAGTRVTVARWSGSDPPVFTTVQAATIRPGEVEVEGVRALHCTLVRGELAGRGTGMPAQSVKAAQAPIIAPSGDDLDLQVGVEASGEELAERARSVTADDGVTFRIWRAVDHFAPGVEDECVYVVDRHTGRISFAPAVRGVDEKGRLAPVSAALGRVPAAGRAIRLWYRRGGGEVGNLPADSLVVLRDPIAGVAVTNPAPSTGGSDAETVDNAVLRAPGAMHSLRRAVTARDFEGVALHSSAAVARAKAFTRAELWKHAVPGTVEVLLVPDLGTRDNRGGGVVTRESLRALENDEVLGVIHAAIERRRPLGTACLVNWVRCKMVTVQVRVVVYRGEDADAVRARVLERLHLTINPLPTPLQRDGWPFGEPLRASHIYDIVLAERGVDYVDRVRFMIDDVPGGAVRALLRDPVQPRTWYAASGPILFRSLDDGAGWEVAGRFEGERVDVIAAHPGRAGLVAVAASLGDNAGARVHVSWDCGDTWSAAGDFKGPVHDLAWFQRQDEPVLLVATDEALYERALSAGASQVQLQVDAEHPTRGFYAVEAFVDSRGGTNVAVAARESGEVFISRRGGATGTFERIHPGGEAIRVLALQRLGMSYFLWAGLSHTGDDDAGGCLRWELPSAPLSVDAPEGWRPMRAQWGRAGSCLALAFHGERVYAATYWRGIQTLDSARPEQGWTASSVQSGLPVHAADNPFRPLRGVAVSEDGAVLLTGGDDGVYRSRDGGRQFEIASSDQFDDKVVLPPTWLFCSGPHDVQVVSADDIR